MRRWPLALALASLVVAAAPVRQALAQPRGFVRVEGTRFVADGKPFYFVGANLNVMHGHKARAWAARTIAAAARDGLTVGRIWALGEGLAEAPEWKRRDIIFRAGPDGWQKRAYAQLDRVLAEARRRGLRLIVTLSNRWSDYGGVPMYLRWAKDRATEDYGYIDRFYSTPQIERWFRQHVMRIVERTNRITGVRYRDDPTIMAWELMNEMSGTPEAAARRRAWFQRMARAIRAVDKRHLIVPGLIGYNLQVERAQWVAMCRLPEASFCDQHIYPEESNRSRGLAKMRSFIDDRVQLAFHVVRKPLIFGEYGFADAGSALKRARLHAQFLQRVFYDGASGALVWIYQPSLHWRRRYGVLVDKRQHQPVRRALARAAARIKRRLPRPQNPRIRPEQGERPLAPTHLLSRKRAAPHRGWRDGALAIPVDQYAAAYFEVAGSWDGGVLVHAYGRRTGWFEYRFVGPPKLPRSLTVRARLSSEYPGDVAPPNGYSLVDVTLDGVVIGRIKVRPDNGVGRWYRVVVSDAALLAKLARRGVHRLRLSVAAGPYANGVAVYGRETPLNREPVNDPGPMQILAR
ncbi:MAG: cellulase family glycosylhydrolase [Myxococcales bacterium]|nr:cellulase family glycosylhydrolase [Myxococcales bacterium]